MHKRFLQVAEAGDHRDGARAATLTAQCATTARDAIDPAIAELHPAETLHESESNVMRRIQRAVIIASAVLAAYTPGALAGSTGLASPAAANTTVFVKMTFAEPIRPFSQGNCPVAPEGFCGSGEVIPLGHATEMIAFGAGCAGSCDLRMINLPGGLLIVDETFSDGSCPRACRPNPASPSSGTLTDVVAGGTGIFAGATGTLSGTVRAAGGIIGPVGSSTVRLSGTIHYDAKELGAAA